MWRWISSPSLFSLRKICLEKRELRRRRTQRLSSRFGCYSFIYLHLFPFLFRSCASFYFFIVIVKHRARNNREDPVRLAKTKRTKRTRTTLPFARRVGMLFLIIKSYRDDERNAYIGAVDCRLLVSKVEGLLYLWFYRPVLHLQRIYINIFVLRYSFKFDFFVLLRNLHVHTYSNGFTNDKIKFTY